MKQTSTKHDVEIVLKFNMGDFMERIIGIFGIIAILAIAYIFSNNRKKINFKLIMWGISLQIFFAILI